MYNWIKAGCPRDRLIIGIPGYGRAFTASGNDPIKAYGEPGSVSSISSPYLGESGLLAFYEVILVFLFISTDEQSIVYRSVKMN